MKFFIRVAVVVILRLLIVYVTSTSGKLNNDCLSPEGTIGTCVVIPECIPIYRMVSRGGNNLTNAEKYYLSNSLCGHQNKQPLVCCTEVQPSQQQQHQQTPQSSQTQSPQSWLSTTRPKPTMTTPAPLTLRPGSQPRATTTRIFETGQLPTDECGAIQDQRRIIGGINTNIGELPWMALIKYVKMPNHVVAFHCSATLISRNFVITAAHCIYGKSIYKHWIPKEIRLGEWNMATSIDCIGNLGPIVDDDDDGDFECADPVLDVSIRRIIPHQYFMSDAKNQYHDIALIQMDQAVEFTDFIKPICLPPSPSSTSLAPGVTTKKSTKTLTSIQQQSGSNYVSRGGDGNGASGAGGGGGVNGDGHQRKFLVAGWGATETTKRSAILRKTTLREIDLNVCATIYRKENLFIMSNQLCAQANERDTCQGDSGAALMAIDKTNLSRPYWYLAGIVSYGMTPCGNPEWPGVYTRISDYVNWIEYTIMKNSRLDSSN